MYLMKMNINLGRKNCQYIYNTFTHQLIKDSSITKGGDIQEKAIFSRIC